MAFNLLKQITDALKSGERLSSQAEAVYNLEAKNKVLKKKLSQIQAPEFIEETARNKLGLGKPDRKSTRLNSSHVAISYAVFCLKKKNKRTIITENIQTR